MTKARPGQTLIEVVMATLISAMTTTAVFSVLLSSFYSTAKADKRDAAAMVLKRAQDTLKSYVSVDPLNSNMINGLPGAGGSPTGRWSADTSGNWALAAGSHNISALLSGTVLTGGTFSYLVADNPCFKPTAASALLTATQTTCKVVTFTLTYPD